MHRSLSVQCFILSAAMIADAAHATLVTIPEPPPPGYVDYGSGDASVTIDSVTFSQQASLGDGVLYNVGTQYSGLPPVLSSQSESVGLANILISLPSAVEHFSLDYGTFFGGSVTFTLSNGFRVAQGSTALDTYAVTHTFDIGQATPFDSVLVTSPDAGLDINTIIYGLPEPGTWFVMALGLGLTGAALRAARGRAARRAA